MDQRVKLIVGAVAVVLILVIITIVVFLVSSARQRSTTNSINSNPESDALNSLNRLRVTPSPSLGGGVSTSSGVLPSTDGLSTYTGTTFSLKYPQNWGLLTCANALNIELDPTDGTLLRGAICDYALKPVTVLVLNQRLSCTGETVTLGSHTVIKNKDVDGSEVEYRWCVNLSNGTSLDITHRVSPSDGRAKSKEDYSPQVEELIKTISISPQSS